MPDPAQDDDKLPRGGAVPWPVVAIAGWAIPGLGHILLGERIRGVLIGLTVLAMFLGGVLLGGVRIIEFPDNGSSLPIGAPKPNLVAQLLSQPVFIAQACTGPIALAAGSVSWKLAHDPNTARLISHSRIYDLGMLYTAIAGALNLLALVDAAARSGTKAVLRDRDEPATLAPSSPASSSTVQPAT
jgi:hypothetical protein